MRTTWDIADAGHGSASGRLPPRKARERDGTGEEDDPHTLLRVAFHDVCAPLSAIHLATQNLRMHLAGGDVSPDRISALVARIERLAADATRLVNDVLLVDERVPAPVLPAEIDVEEPLESAISFHAEALSSVHSSIVVTRDTERPNLRGTWDGRALESIFSNLLQNAIRHAPGTSITIHLSRIDDDVAIRFSDHGPGIKASSWESSPSLSKGYGLGMWIVRRAVSRLGGTISIRNNLEAGLAIDLRFPMRRHRSAAP